MAFFSLFGGSLPLALSHVNYVVSLMYSQQSTAGSRPAASSPLLHFLQHTHETCSVCVRDCVAMLPPWLQYQWLFGGQCHLFICPPSSSCFFFLWGHTFHLPFRFSHLLHLAAPLCSRLSDSSRCALFICVHVHVCVCVCLLGKRALFAEEGYQGEGKKSGRERENEQEARI